MLGVQFVVSVGVKAAEAVVAGFVCDVGLDGLCLDVHEINHAGRNRGLAAVDHDAVDGAELCVGFLILRADGQDRGNC